MAARPGLSVAPGLAQTARGLAAYAPPLAPSRHHGAAWRYPAQHVDLQGRPDHAKPQHGPACAHGPGHDHSALAHPLRRTHYLASIDRHGRRALRGVDLADPG